MGVIPTSLALEALCRSCPCVLEGILASPPEVDWEAQWALHGHDYQDGYVHLDLQGLGLSKTPASIRLKPGPGFGDFSHPTTRLALKLLSEVAPGACVIDIGSGSGILTLCAIALGARKAIGLEIDPIAVAHGEANAMLNHMEDRATFLLSNQFSLNLETAVSRLKPDEAPVIVVMNMIHSEQAVAWSSCSSLHAQALVYLTSGILQGERALYLKQCQERGWQLNREIGEEEWLAFMFSDQK